MMDLFSRQQELKQLFRIGEDVKLTHSPIEIRFCNFHSDATNKQAATDNNSFDMVDHEIEENFSFQYPVFRFQSSQKSENAIIMLHGLNERTWDKYLSWAEFLCLYTRRPVVLFPLAFHMNRSESGWLNLRNIFNFLPTRLKKIKQDQSLSVANYILSERLSENPIRFYTSGRQSLKDITVLVKDIQSGEHVFFEKDCQTDIFAYSIGAFLTQIALMANPEKLFSTTNAFLFCGGSLFKHMNGQSRSIMDKTSHDLIHAFYSSNEWMEHVKDVNKDEIALSFASMIDTEIHKSNRYQFFNQLKDRMKIISLVKDKVISYEGIKAAVGNVFANKNVNTMDYAYLYTHENPFPVNNSQQRECITNCFNQTFSIIGDFFNSKHK
ncbi:MAG: DUF6051 family protein [Bacteroidales bacterium]|nr:DUF6051 family protein [Bacteroidales bacterium]MDD4209897.1 DUF6051 family protein [Bacteroidales bacterium]